MSTTTVGIIGGTGLYALDGLQDVHLEHVDTPFGTPSAPLTVGFLGEVKLIFLARHGVHHELLPSEINYRANIFALKKLGCQWCISVSAVGSLLEELKPGHLVLPDQLIDRTSGIRPSTFFGKGLSAHVSLAMPFCPTLSEVLYKAGTGLLLQGEHSVPHRGGTYVCMEGPAFSTRAESELYRSWGASLIGMTALPEAKLAREAELAYSILALVTDYDCWRNREDDVSAAEVVETMSRNVQQAKKVLSIAVENLRGRTPSAVAANALSSAFLTQPKSLPLRMKEELAPIIGRYTS